MNVTAVLPGWTRTEFHARGGSGRKGVPGFLWLDPDQVAAEALRDAARRPRDLGAVAAVQGGCRRAARCCPEA